MKIDSHNHFWLYNDLDYGWISDDLSILRRDFTPNDLWEELQKNKFDGTIAVQARQSLEETEWLLQLAETNDFIKGVVGWVDLQSDEVESQLIHFSNNKKFVGVRHVLQDEADDRFALNDRFLKGISLLSKYNLTYDILVFERQLPAIIELVAKFPNQRFVVDHIAKPLIKDQQLHPWKENIEKLAEFPNVFCKLSGMLTEAVWSSWKQKDFTTYFDTVLACFGTKRLMFGSDWPVSQLAGSYSQTVQILEEYMADFTPAEKNGVMGDNALNFYINKK